MKKVLVFIVVFVVSCTATVKRVDVQNEDCYIFLKCLEMNAKNHDKSSCALIGDACREALREGRKK
jgi:hypothetical protein